MQDNFVSDSIGMFSIDKESVFCPVILHGGRYSNSIFPFLEFVTAAKSHSTELLTLEWKAGNPFINSVAYSEFF